MTTVTVEVTAADIESGRPKFCTLCPVATALERATGKRWFVELRYAHLMFAERRQIELPPAVRAFIEAFDAGRPVEPFVFPFPWVQDAA